MVPQLMRLVRRSCLHGDGRAGWGGRLLALTLGRQPIRQLLRLFSAVSRMRLSSTRLIGMTSHLSIRPGSTSYKILNGVHEDDVSPPSRAARCNAKRGAQSIWT